MTFIIAECGVNHDGQWEKGLDLIDAAQHAGADAIKFQHFRSQALWGDDRIAHLELSDNAMTALAAHCREVGMEFMCTPFGVLELNFLKPLLRRVKISSGCLTDWELLDAVKDCGLPIILSTGMSDISQVDNALSALGYQYPARYPDHEPDRYTLLHCVSAYPCPHNQANLASMEVLKFHYGLRCKIGYSDHTDSIYIPAAAVGMGATVIEKHLTMDREAIGPDHKASLDPDQFRRMVQGIRQVEQAIGKATKQLQPAEAETWRQWYAD
jgi:sialic acid synthase SpsE